MRFDSKASRWAAMQTREIANKSQYEFDKVAKSPIRVVFDSLYPVEKPFLDFRSFPARLLGRRIRDEALITATGISPARLEKLRQDKDYFTELLEQYAFLAKGQGESPCGEHQYRVAKDYEDMMAHRERHPDCLLVIPTIEGGHALGVGSPLYLRLPEEEVMERLTENIRTVKSWEHPPFFMNLAHHFWNQLCGHSRSLKAPVSGAFNQKEGMDLGIQPLGWHALRELLTRENGRRILIDIKHMSALSRQEYYGFVQSHNRIHPEDPIPIICSHTGVNGFSTMAEAMAQRDTSRKMKRSYFNNWSLNLCDEEIRLIHETGGLIGLMVDKGLLGSARTLAKIAQMDSREARKDAFMELMLRNLFRIIRAVGKESAWDLVAMGSDYDGLITHIDGYDHAVKLVDLRSDLIEYMERTRFREKWWFGHSPAALLRKVFQENAMRFLQRHYHATAPGPQIQGHTPSTSIQTPNIQADEVSERKHAG